MTRRALVVALALAALACGRAPSPPTRAAATITKGPARYEQAIDAAAARGLRVWLEVDLAKRWLSGKASFAAAIDRLGALASRRGVVGIKIADELGYRTPFDRDPARVSAFLREAAVALRRVAPNVKILVDLTVPELGCAPGVDAARVDADACRATMRARVPALRLENVDAMLAEGNVDVLDLSTGLLGSSTYARWGISDVIAQQAAWTEAVRRGWPLRVTLQGRKALAHTGAYRQSAADAEHDLAVFVDQPRASGAAAVDVWTWRQPYRGDVMRLMDPGNAPNALWRGLVARRKAGARLFTHFTPSSLEAGLGADLDRVAEAFSDLFVAAGLG